MRVDEFDFDLPPENIALRPANPRDAARLLLVTPGCQPQLSDKQVKDLPDLLQPGDILVANDTRVIPARLYGKRMGRGTTTPKIEVTLHQKTTDNTWLAFARPARKLEKGDVIAFGSSNDVCMAESLVAKVSKKGQAGEVELTFELSGPFLEAAIAAHGDMPLPPYIASKRPYDNRDDEDYQTIYAQHKGAVAAPTAGLHFTPELMNRLQKNGIDTEYLTLHVGAGTFLPVKVDEVKDHKMHAENGILSQNLAERLNTAKAAGRRIIAVGTTALRLLESATDETGKIHAFSDSTQIFITPGYRFKCVDGLMTNFHLPRSTLFMLVCAFAGQQMMHRAYKHAIQNNYRFYSYGDSSLLFPESR